MYRYLESTKTVENKELKEIVLSNAQNGTWIKIPKEWKNILDQLIDYDKSYEEFLQLFRDVDDKKKFSNMVTLLENKGFITRSEHEDYKLKTIYLAITERCNLKCRHCCYDAKTANINSDLDSEKITRIIDIVAEANPETIVLSGGEPLMRADFMRLLSHLRSNYTGNITLSTNGLLISDRNIYELVKMTDHFAISVDGYDEESCSVIRGKGVFNKVIENVKKLKLAGAKEISLSMVQMENQGNSTELFKQLNLELGTKPVIRVLAPTGRGANLLDGERYVRQTYREHKLNDDEAELYSKTCIACKCGGATRDFLIDYDGSVYPCGLMIDADYKLGNILEFKNMKEFIKSMKTKNGYMNFLEIFPENFAPCKDCNVNIFCWHCLQELDLAKHHPELVPIRCSIRKENLYKLVWGKGDKNCES